MGEAKRRAGQPPKGYEKTPRCKANWVRVFRHKDLKPGVVIEDAAKGQKYFIAPDGSRRRLPERGAEQATEAGNES